MSLVTDLSAVVLDLLNIFFNFKQTVTIFFKCSQGVKGTKANSWAKTFLQIFFGVFPMSDAPAKASDPFVFFGLGFPCTHCRRINAMGFLGKPPRQFRLPVGTTSSNYIPTSVQTFRVPCYAMYKYIYIFSAGRQQKYLSLGCGKSLVSVPAHDGLKGGGEAGQREALVETLEGRITGCGVSHWLFSRQP